MLFLIKMSLVLGLIMLPFILYWEVGIPLIITAPLWYIVMPFAIIGWIVKSNQRQRDAFGKHLLPEEKDAVNVTGEYFYKNFLKDCIKCCARGHSSVHVVVRACGEHGEWLKRDERPKYLLTDNEATNNTEHILRYFVFLTNQYIEKSTTDETYSFLRGYDIKFYDNEVSSMLQFFIS